MHKLKLLGKFNTIMLNKTPLLNFFNRFSLSNKFLVKGVHTKQETDHNKDLSKKEDNQEVFDKSKNCIIEENREIHTSKGKSKIMSKTEIKNDKNSSFYSFIKETTYSSSESNKDKKLDGISELDEQEKIVYEGGKAKKVTTIKKTMMDGTIKTEIHEKYI